MNQYADLPSPDQEVARDQTPVKSIPRKFRSESQKPESPDQNANIFQTGWQYMAGIGSAPELESQAAQNNQIGKITGKLADFVAVFSLFIFD